MYLQAMRADLVIYLCVLNKPSPMDLMYEYAKVYKVEYGDMMSEV